MDNPQSVAVVVDGLQPQRELGIEFVQVAGGLAGQAQTRLEILLDRKEHAFAFSFGVGRGLRLVMPILNRSSRSFTRFIRGTASNVS
jgi:hypothetical protein